MTELKVLESPSKMKQFDQCELLGQLTYLDRWEPLEAVNSMIPRLRGNAFAKACEVLHNALREGDKGLLETPSFVSLAVDQAIALFDKQYTYCAGKGMRFRPEADALSRAELRRVIPLYARQTPLKQWEITHVEYPIKKFGCRPDLMGKDHQTFYATADMKYKTSLEAKYVDSTIEEFHWDFQFQQYPEAYRDLLGIGDDVPVYSYLILVTGTPFNIRPVGWLYTPEQRLIWRQSADALTSEIREVTSGKRLPRAAATHRSKYGWCPMKKACLEYNLDPHLMRNDYVQLDELPE